MTGTVRSARRKEACERETREETSAESHVDANECHEQSVIMARLLRSLGMGPARVPELDKAAGDATGVEFQFDVVVR